MKISKENIYDLVKVTLLNVHNVVLKGVTFSVSNKDFDQGIKVVFEWGSEVAILNSYKEEGEAGTLEAIRCEPKTPSSTGPLDIKMKNEIYLLRVTLLNSQDEDLYGMTLFVSVEEFEQGIKVVRDWGSEVKVLTEGEAGSCEATPMVFCEPKPSSTGPLMKVGRPAIYQILMAVMIATSLLVYYGEMEERVEVDAGYGEMEWRIVADVGYFN
jgi:hypothetical protein